MRGLASRFRRLRARYRYRHFDRDLREELAVHEQQAREDQEKQGFNRREAERRARAQVGNVTLAREGARGVWFPSWIDGVRADLRFGVRALLRHPGKAFTSVATLGVAIALISSVFTVFNGLYLKQLAVPAAGRVFAAALTPPPGAPDDGMPFIPLFFGYFESLKQRSTRADLVASIDVSFRVRVGQEDSPTRARSLAVSPDFFEVLRVPLNSGRAFAAASESGDVAVISHGFWQTVLASDAGAVGRTIYLNDAPTTVIGIVSPSFVGAPYRRDLYVPLPSRAAWASTWKKWTGRERVDPARLGVDVMGRLRSGWNRSDAQLELQTLPPPVSGSNGPRLVQLTGTAPGQRSGVPKTTEVIFDLLFAGCLLVLLLACANVGSIQLARMLTRRPEIATRLALGASRGRIIRQLLTEGLLMTLGAAGFALAAAFILPAAVLGPLEGPNPTLSFAPDLTVFVVCLALSLASWLAVGLGPALHITGQRGLGMDRLRGRSVTAVTGRWRSVLLGTQLAIGMALLIGATLLSRSLQGAISNDLGYAEGIAYSSIQAPQGPYEGAQSLAFVEALRGRMEAEGFRDIAFTRRAPLSRGITTVEARLVGAPPESAKDVRLGNVSASYFSVLESEFAEGRAFADDPRTLDVVVNQALIRAFKLPSPTTGSVIVVNGATRTIVGVVRDQHLDNLEPVRPTLFQPIVAGRIMTVLVRSTDPEAGRRLLSAIHAIDPGLPAIAGSLTDLVEPLTRQNRVGVAIASAISAVALGLAAVGVFGLFGFLVEHRRREIGIRLVLGAKRSELVQLVFAGAKGAMLGGLTAGLLLSFLVGDALKRFLFGMTPVDPISYLVACGILAAAIGLGTFVPARRAVSVDPAETLRSE